MVAALRPLRQILIGDFRYPISEKTCRSCVSCDRTVGRCISILREIFGSQLTQLLQRGLAWPQRADGGNALGAVLARLREVVGRQAADGVEGERNGFA